MQRKKIIIQHIILPFSCLYSDMFEQWILRRSRWQSRLYLSRKKFYRWTVRNT